MKIKRVAVWKEALALTKPYAIASGSFDAVDNIFIRLDADKGGFGIGVASPATDVTGESTADCYDALTHCLAPELQGRQIGNLGALVGELSAFVPAAPAAMAAVDMAMHDLLATGAGIPLVDYLGRCHHSLATSVTIGISPVVQTLEEASTYVDQGFRILKVKIGQDVEEDLERLFRLRERAGSDITIRVDINQGYTPEAFADFVRKSEPLDLELAEQPLNRDHTEAMLRYPEAVRKKAAADESLHDVQDALRLAEHPQPFGIFNIKLMKCGGITPGVRIADIARRAGIDLMWGCMDESVVGIAAALHAALACPATRYLDLDGHLDLARDLAAGGFELCAGQLRTLNRPGLGVVLR